MRIGFTRYETLAASLLLCFTLVLAVIAATQKRDNAPEERNMWSFLREKIEAADRDSFVVSDTADGCLVSFNTSTSKAQRDVNGKPIPDEGYVCYYDSLDDQLVVQRVDLTPANVTQPAYVLDNVYQFGFYYHKPYSALQLIFNKRQLTVTSWKYREYDGSPNTEPSDPDLYWSDLAEELPLALSCWQQERVVASSGE